MENRHAFTGGLASSLALLASFGFCACFPSPIAVVADNTPPVIDRRRTLPDVLGIVSIRQTAAAQSPAETSFVLRIVDPDPEDIKVRFFLDARGYNVPDPFGIGIRTVAASPGTDARALIEPIRGFCDQLTLGLHTFEAFVTDTNFVDGSDGLPLYYITGASETDSAGGRDFVRWTVDCQLPN